MKTAHLALGLASLGLIACAHAAAPAYDQPGPLAVNALDFPDLTDPARQGRRVPRRPQGAPPPVQGPARRAAHLQSDDGRLVRSLPQAQARRGRAPDERIREHAVRGGRDAGEVEGEVGEACGAQTSQSGLPIRLPPNGHRVRST